MFLERVIGGRGVGGAFGSVTGDGGKEAVQEDGQEDPRKFPQLIRMQDGAGLYRVLAALTVRRSQTRDSF